MSHIEGVVLINPFDVPPGADEQFIAGWERARDFLETQQGYVDTALHKALAQDAEFRFVNVAHLQSPEAWQKAVTSPDFPGRQMPFRAHPALYRVILEDGEVRDEANAVVLVNPFEVQPDHDDEFLKIWQGGRDFMRTRVGYLSTRLHQSITPQADFRFVNIAVWKSPQAFQAAVQDPEFPSMGSTPFRPHPALYRVIRR